MSGWLSSIRNTKRIDAKDNVCSIAFLADGKHIVSGGYEEKIRQWRADNGKEEGVPMDTGSLIYSIAVSRDSKWIVSGTYSGEVMVWETKTGKKTTEFHGHSSPVHAVDISPSGTRIVTGSDDHTASVWSTSTGERLLGPKLEHDYHLTTVKFSPDGLLVATATFIRESVRVYDSRNGDLLVEFVISIRSWFKTSLAWSSNTRLFASSYDGNINCLDVSTRTTLSRWPIHGLDNSNCIALATNGLFIAASNESSVSFWDTTTHEQVGPIVHHTSNIYSMAISANFDLAMTGDKKITLCHLRDILPSHCFDIIAEPAKESLEAQEKGSSGSRALNLIHASDTTLDLWRRDKLLEAIGSISQGRRKVKAERHHLLATRAFLRARLRQWGPAIIDAQKSIDIRPNTLAYIALGMARVGRGNVESGKETFHRLLYKCNVDGMISFVFLIKAVVMFTFGHREEAIIRVGGLIFNSLEHEKVSCRAVQTHMRLVEAKACIGRQEYEKALELIADLHDTPQFPSDAQIDCISLMFGWSFDSDIFKFLLYQQRCEALCGLGRKIEAGMLLDQVWMDLERRSVSRKEVKEWVQDFTGRLVQKDLAT